LTVSVGIAQAEVYDLDVSVFVEEKVLRLQVAVNHIHLMYLLDTI
jgi:hypothetical protein